MPAAVLCAALSLSTGALAAHATPPPPGSIQLVDVSPTAGVASSGNHSEEAVAVSGNARFVAFISSSSDLVGANGEAQLYLRDIVAGTTHAIGGPGLYSMGVPSITDDGTRVAYLAASSVPGPSGIVNPNPQAYVWSSATDSSTLVSDGYSGLGEGVNDWVWNVDISASGNAVVYDTKATDVLPGDPYVVPRMRVYKHDLTGATSLVAYDPAQTEERPVISGDGRYVAFLSADNHTALPSGGEFQVYLRDTLLATTELITLNSSATAGADASSSAISMSADARFIAFESFASDLEVSPVAAEKHVFVRDRMTGRTTLESRDDRGEPAIGSTPSISATGQVIVYEGDDGQVYAKSRRTGVIHLMSQNKYPEEGDARSLYPVISADGHFAAWSTRATNLTPDSYPPYTGTGHVSHFVIRNLG